MIRAPAIRQSLLAVFAVWTVASRAELVVQSRESIFDVDGLKVDSLDIEASRTGKYFHAEVKQFPLIDRSQPAAPLSLPPVRGASRVGASPRGEAYDRLKAAEVYASQADWEKSLNEIQQALELEPNNMILIRRGAAVAALARKYGAADELFRRVVEANPDDIAFLTGRAGVLIRLLRLKEADEMVQRALKIDPNYLTARFDLACIQIARGDASPSRSDWDRLTTDELLQVANWLDADQVDYVAALSDKGFAELCRVVLGSDAGPNLKIVLESLRQASDALRANQWPDVERALRHLKTLGVSTVGTEMDIARAESEAGQKESAVAALQALSVRFPTTPSVLYNQAFILINMEKYSDAAAVLEKELQLDPNDAQARFALGCAYAALGQMDKTWPLLQALAVSNPSDMRSWMVGDEPYLIAIRKDPRYSELVAGAARGVAPAPKRAAAP